MKKETKVQLLIIVILSIILILLLIVFSKKIDILGRGFYPRFEDEKSEKETLRDDVSGGSSINTKSIILNDYNSNITISEGGIYDISGSFNYSLLVDSKDKVTLNLKGVTINSSITAAIANRGSGDLVINIEKGTTNVLKDNGSSEFDGCIYSSGKLFIDGSGILKVYGNQKEGEGIATTDKDITINGGEIYIESNDDGLNVGGDNGGIITINGGNIFIKADGDGIDSNGSLVINGGSIYTIGSAKGGDAGIDTDRGYEINGGSVIAIGSDMLEKPINSSKQKFVTFSLKEVINSGSEIVLKNGSNDIISFTAKENFKTLILSNSKMNSGVYDLFVNGNKTSYSYTIK